ncbi:hypothetical protein KBC55_03895 [Patescibacteria group bacterium]|nr:hypothetical protein [Patescibacteria group bacterium]
MLFAEQERARKSQEAFKKNSPANNLTSQADRDRFQVLTDSLKRNGIDALPKGKMLVEATRLCYPEECPNHDTLSASEASQLVRRARSVMFYCVSSEAKRDSVNNAFIELQDQITNQISTEALARFIGAAIS